MELGLPQSARSYAALAESEMEKAETDRNEYSLKRGHVYAMLSVAASIQEHGLFAEHPDD